MSYELLLEYESKNKLNSIKREISGIYSYIKNVKLVATPCVPSGFFLFSYLLQLIAVV